MDLRTRTRKNKDGTYFNPEDYFLRSFEECSGCLQSQERSQEDHYHCLVCHKDLKGSTNPRY